MAGCGDSGTTLPLQPEPEPPDPDLVRPLAVHLLDIGRGDAILIVNGDSRVIIDGGHTVARFAEKLDQFELNGTRLDAVILTHPHSDHASGLRELFRDNREIEIGYFFDNPSLATSSVSAQAVRDSAQARADRGELVLRDAADPCGDGSPVCTFRLDGQARLHVMRPFPDARNTDDGSIPVKLVGPDSASFSMWMAGDARWEASEWFENGAMYHVNPGMRVSVLKGQEHGHCRSLPQRLLELTNPDWVTFSLDEEDGSGRVHEQTKDRLLVNAISWYRTDRNGTVTIHSPGVPGGGYSISAEVGAPDQDGPADAVSTSSRC